MSGKLIRIFVASSSELKEEREKCILLINQLNKSHTHLVLEPVEWEYDLVHSSYPGNPTIQDAIDPHLQNSQMGIFIFYSKIGKYTRQEFEYAGRENKKLFVYFKDGFSPKSKDTHQLFGELLDFKESLADAVLYKMYEDLNEFEKLLYTNLNLELTQTHPPVIAPAADETVNNLSQSNLELIRLLSEKEKEITRLKETLVEYPMTSTRQELARIEQEKEEINRQLLRSREVIEQQAKDKAELEKQLIQYEGKNALKEKALGEVEKGNYDEAESLLKESAKESITETAATFFELGKIKKLQLKYMDSLGYYELAIKIEPGNALYLNDAGFMASYLGYYDKAIEYYECSMVLLETSEGDERAEIAIRYNNLGGVYYKKGNFNKAIECYEKAITIEKELYDEENLGLGSRYNNLGTVYSEMGDYDKAIELYTKALDLDKKAYGEEHPDIAIDYNNIGLLYDNKGDYDKAIEFYQKSLSMKEKFFGKDYPSVAITIHNLAAAYAGKNEYKIALQYNDQALHVYRKCFPPDHPEIKRTLGWRAIIEKNLK